MRSLQAVISLLGVAAEMGHRAAALPAPRDAAQHEPRDHAALGLAGELALLTPYEVQSGLRLAMLDRLPEVIRDDAQRGGGDSDPLALRDGLTLALAVIVHVPHLAVDPLADVERVGQHPADEVLGPAGRPWGFRVEQVADAVVAQAVGRELEDAPHHLRLVLVDPVLDVVPGPL